MFAVVGFEVGFFVAAGTASVFTLTLGLVNHGGGYDAGGDGDDGVAEDHDEPRKDATDGGDGGDVAIADGGEGNDCPENRSSTSSIKSSPVKSVMSYGCDMCPACPPSSMTVCKSL